MENTNPPQQHLLPLNVKLLGLGAALAIVIIGIFIASIATRPSHQGQPAPTPSLQKSTAPVTNLIPKPSGQQKIVEGQIIVRFKDGVSSGQINIDLQQYQAKIIRQIPALHRTVIQVPTGQEDLVLQKLSQDKLIEEAEPDQVMHADFTPNDPLYPQQWGLANTGQSIENRTGQPGDDIKAERAWDITRGNGVKVAVIDSGIDLNHPDFAGKIIAQKIYITDTLDDQYGHGTHVAGAIAGTGNNGQGITGVCPECQLMIAKALNDQGIGPESGIAEAITWAVDNGAKVINISAGGDKLTQTIQAAIDYAHANGSIIVCSSGNNGDTIKTYPAALDSVVSVAATDNRDQLASFSTYGSWVKVAAPGTNMMSTLPTHAFSLQRETTPALSTTYDFLSGTSMSAPIVSGTLALIWASPYGTSNTAVINRLYTTADKIAGTGLYWAYGRINAAKAVGADATPTQPTSTNTPLSIDPTMQLDTPTPTPPSPSFTCLGACITPSPSPLPTIVLPTNIPIPPHTQIPQTIQTGNLQSILTLITTIQPSKSNCKNHYSKKTFHGRKCKAYHNKKAQSGLLAIISLLLLTLLGGGTIPNTLPTILTP